MYADKQLLREQQVESDTKTSSDNVSNCKSESFQCRFSPDGVVQKTSGLGPAASNPNQTGMPDRLKNGLESLSGYDISSVRVHYNSPKPKQLGALAYTHGTNIHLGRGQEGHLPHEGWHVVQQMQGRVRPTVQMKGIGVNDDESLEREADMMSEKA